MRMKQILVAAMACGILGSVALAQSGKPVRMYNTAKQKLMAGKKIVGGTVSSSDPEIYCAMANAGWDYTWIEMQHSVLGYHEVATMIRACKGATAIPFIRVPNDNEGDIQKAVDLGALGIIIPMVETLEKVQNTVKYAKYPPMGARSQGGGQYGAMWGSDYRQTANDNILIVAMIESPKGVAIADKIAAVPGVDVVFVASTDLGSFSGHKQGEPEYEALVARIKDATLSANLKLGGPFAWANRPGFTFFQGPGESAMINAGAKVTLGAPAVTEKKTGVAHIEGSEPK